MPFVIPIVAGVAITVAAASITSTALLIAATVAISVASYAAQKALTKKPKSDPVQLEGRTVTVRQPIGPAQIWYGYGKQGGTIIFLDKAGNDTWIAVCWAFHPVNFLGDVSLNDDVISVYSNGSTDGSFDGVDMENRLFVYHHLGDEDQTVDTNLQTAFPLLWTERHRCRGRAYSVFKFVNTPTNFPKGIPQLSVFGNGHARVFDTRTGLYGYSENPILCLRDQLTSTVYGFGVPFTDIDDTALGIEADYCDEEIETVPPQEYYYLNEYTGATATNVSLNLITFSPAPGIFTGDEVRLAPGGGGVMPGGLTANTSYFANRNTSVTFGFALTRQDALDGTLIDITSTGTQPVQMWRVDGVLRLGGPQAPLTGVDTAQDELDGIGLQIKVTGGVRWRMTTTSTIPGGLLEGQTYFGEVGIGNGMTASLTPGGALIDITGTGAGTRTVRFDGSGMGMSSASLTTGVVAPLGLSPFITEEWPVGNRLVFRANGGSLAPLVDEAVYYWIPIAGSSSGRIAKTRADAENGVHINFSAALSGSPYFESDYHSTKVMVGLMTGDRVRLDPDIFGGSNIYYWIKKSNTTGYVADTHADAVSGVAKQFLTEPQNVTVGAVRTRNTILRQAGPRLSCNGIYSTGEDMDTVQQALLTSCAGDVLEPVLSGKWRIKAGRYRVPLHSLDETSIRGDGQVQIQPRQSVGDAVNTVRGNQVTAENDDQPADFPEYADERFIEEDGREVLVKDIQLPFTNSKEMALRLAKIELMQGRMQRTMTLPIWFDAAPGLEVGDSIDVTLSAMSYTDKTFKVVERTVSFEASEGEVPMPQIDLTIRETGIKVYR